MNKVHRVGRQIKLILCPMDRRLDGDTTIHPGREYTIINTPIERKDLRNGKRGVWIQGEYRPIFIWTFEYLPVREVSKRTKRSPKSFIPRRTK